MPVANWSRPRAAARPIAEEGVRRIGELYRIEAELRGLNADARLAGRQERSTPLIADMRTWLTHHRARVAGKSPLGEALSYIPKYWDGLCVFLIDGRIEIDNKPLSEPSGRLSLIARTISSPDMMREQRTRRPPPRCRGVIRGQHKAGVHCRPLVISTQHHEGSPQLLHLLSTSRRYDSHGCGEIA